MNKKSRRRIEKIFSQIDKIASKGRNNFLEYYQYVDNVILNSDYDNLLQSLYQFYDIDIDKLNSIDDIKSNTWNIIVSETKDSLTKRLKRLYDNQKIYQLSFDIFSSETKYITSTMSNPLSSEYLPTNISSGISFSRNNDNIDITIINPNIYSVKISKAVWGTQSGVYKATDIRLLQTITGITQSVSTQIPITHGGEYLVTTEERPNYKLLNYRLEVVNNNYLGSIVEFDVFTEDTKYLLKNREFAKLTDTRRIDLRVTKKDNIPVIIDGYDGSISNEQNVYNKYVNAINILKS